MAWTPIAAWVMIVSRRRSNRSAKAPAQSPINSIGRNWQAVTMPSASPLPPRLRTSSTWAVACSHVPTFETARPAKNNLALRSRNERNICEPRASEPRASSTTTRGSGSTSAC